MSASRTIVALLAAAALGAGCVRFGYQRDIVEVRPPDAVVAAFVVGATSLDEVLLALGAPLDVWEAGGGSTAVTYGGLKNREWSADVSVPVTDTASASLSYTDSHARTRGWLMLFDGSDRLELVRAGNLGDLRRQYARRPSSSVEDAP